MSWIYTNILLLTLRPDGRQLELPGVLPQEEMLPKVCCRGQRFFRVSKACH
jgi:hypothetical protein